MSGHEELKGEAPRGGWQVEDGKGCLPLRGRGLSLPPQVCAGSPSVSLSVCLSVSLSVFLFPFLSLSPFLPCSCAHSLSLLVSDISVHRRGYTRSSPRSPFRCQFLFCSQCLAKSDEPIYLVLKLSSSTSCQLNLNLAQEGTFSNSLKSSSFVHAK